MRHAGGDSQPVRNADIKRSEIEMNHETMEVYQVSVKNGFRPCPTCKNQGLYMTSVGTNPGENGNMRHVICPKCGRAWVVDSTLTDLIKAWNEGEGIQAKDFPKRTIKLKLLDDGTIPKEMVVQLICEKPERVETTVEEIYSKLTDIYGEEAVEHSSEKLRRIFGWKDQSAQKER